MRRPPDPALSQISPHSRKIPQFVQRRQPAGCRLAAKCRSTWTGTHPKTASTGSSRVSRPCSLMAASRQAMTALIVTARSTRCPVPCPGYSTLQANLGIRRRDHRSTRSPHNLRVIRGETPQPATGPELEDNLSEVPARLGACESVPAASVVRPFFARSDRILQAGICGRPSGRWLSPEPPQSLRSGN